MNIRELGRRDDAEAALREQGVEGAAAEFLLRRSASDRHAMRVAKVREAVREALPTAHLGGGEADALVFLTTLDAVGVGGPQGVGGDATARVPAFAGLGKGRKQASDGPAWTAAIEAAAYAAASSEEFGDEARQAHTLRAALAEDGSWAGVETVAAGGGYGCQVWVGVDPGEREVALWVRALAGEALQRLAGYDARRNLRHVTLLGEPRAWARVFETSEACLRELRAAHHVARDGRFGALPEGVRARVVGALAERLQISPKGEPAYLGHDKWSALDAALNSVVGELVGGFLTRGVGVEPICAWAQAQGFQVPRNEHTAAWRAAASGDGTYPE